MNFTPCFKKKTANILVLDDDRIFGRIVSKHLLHLKEQYAQKGLQLHFEVHDNSYEGLKSLDRQLDLVLLDYQLEDPDDLDITGLDVLKEIKCFNPAIQVYMVSGQKNELIAEALKDSGADRYIQKGTNAMHQVIKYMNEYFVNSSAA